MIMNVRETPDEVLSIYIASNYRYKIMNSPGSISMKYDKSIDINIFFKTKKDMYVLR